MSFPRTDDARTASLRSDTALCVPDTELVIVFVVRKPFKQTPDAAAFVTVTQYQQYRSYSLSNHFIEPICLPPPARIPHTRTAMI